MHANGERCSGKKQAPTLEKENGRAVSFKYLWKVNEIMRRCEVVKILPKRNNRNRQKAEQINSGNREEILMADETFDGPASSIQVQPVELRRQARELHKKPRGGSRGAVTRSLSGR
jgi:hypothetical protein